MLCTQSTRERRQQTHCQSGGPAPTISTARDLPVDERVMSHFRSIGVAEGQAARRACENLTKQEAAWGDRPGEAGEILSLKVSGSVSDRGSTPRVSTNFMPGSPLTTWQLSAGPAPYGDVMVSTGRDQGAGGNRQATTWNSGCVQSSDRGAGEGSTTAQTQNANDETFALPIAA